MERTDGTFTKADDWIFIGTARDADKTPFNLTGATVKLRVKDKVGNIIFDYVTPTNGQILNAAQGTYQFIIPNATVRSKNLTDAKYFYSVHVTLGNGSETDQNYGDIRLEDSLF